MFAIIAVVLLTLVAASLAACRSSEENPAPVPKATDTPPVPLSVALFFPQDAANDIIFVMVRRNVDPRPSTAEAAIAALLEGPTAEEQASGLYSPIPEGTRLKSLSIAGGVARVDFDERMEQHQGGSVRVMAIRQMITRTLKQFPGVDDIIISVEGETEDILQP